MFALLNSVCDGPSAVLCCRTSVCYECQKLSYGQLNFEVVLNTFNKFILLNNVLEHLEVQMWFCCLISVTGNMSDIRENSFGVKRYQCGWIVVPVH